MTHSSRRIVYRIALAGLALALGAAAAGCSLLPREEDELAPPLVKPAQENYRTGTVTRGSIVQAFKASGTVEAAATELVRYTGNGGRLEQIHVGPGDRVKKGDLLATMDPEGLDLQLKEQELQLERARYGVRTAGDDAQLQKIARLQLEVEEIRYGRVAEQLNMRQLYAGIDGLVIYTSSMEHGDWINPYTTLVRIADLSYKRVVLKATGQELAKDVRPGMAAEVVYGEATVAGTVVQTPGSAPETADPQQAQQDAETIVIDVPELPREAEIGSFAVVSIVLDKRDDVVKIPRSGLRSYMGRNFVRVLENGSQLREVDVEAGLIGPTEVEIIQGLEEGQTIVMQ